MDKVGGRVLSPLGFQEALGSDHSSSTGGFERFEKHVKCNTT